MAGTEARIRQEQVFHALGYPRNNQNRDCSVYQPVLISAPKGFGHGAAAEMPKGKWGLGDDLPQCSSTQPGLCPL